jgi:uncharacterized protein YraI
MKSMQRQLPKLPPRSSLKYIAATLDSSARTLVRGLGLPIIGLVILILLAAPGAIVRAAEPITLAQVRLPTPTPNRNAATATSPPPPVVEVIIAESTPPEPSATETTSANDVRDAPLGTVLVERLRLRAGPGEEYPILERTFTGDTVQLLGQSDACDWLLVLSPTGQQGWVSGDPALIAHDVGCALLAPSRVILSTPTVSPTPSATSSTTPTRTATPTMTPTPQVAPAIALRPAISPWTPTPVPTPTRPRPAATATAVSTAVSTAVAAQPTANPLATIAAVGPRSVTNLLPVTDTETRLRIPFAWVADAPLAEGQLFEVAFWRKGQPQEEAQGWTSATRNTTLSANTYEQIPGDYRWGVWLGAMVDGTYHRLRFLGGGNLLRVLPEASEEVAAPAATNCPPTAPCK